MTAEDFKQQMDFCLKFNTNKEVLTVLNVCDFLEKYYKQLFYFKRNLTIAAFSKTKTEKFDDLSQNLLQHCIKSFNVMDLNNFCSFENQQIILNLIQRCISAIQGIGVALEKLNRNSDSITFDNTEEHASKINSLKNNYLLSITD